MKILTIQIAPQVAQPVARFGENPQPRNPKPADHETVHRAKTARFLASIRRAVWL